MESQPHSVEHRPAEVDDERDTTPVLEGVPFYMTTDGGYEVDPNAISSSPIRSYQQISSLNERSNFDYRNQFATSKKKRSTSSSVQGETSHKAKSKQPVVQCSANTFLLFQVSVTRSVSLVA